MKDLIERYLYAATKRLPSKQREDVAEELRGLIDDLLIERCGQQTPTEKDVRIVLMELGSPEEVYGRYAENADKCLIGQPYYDTYKYVLKIVLIAVTVGMTIANLILQVLEPETLPSAALGWLAQLYNALLASFSIVTLLFAFFYHKGVKLTQPFNFDELPPVPKKNEVPSKWENIAGIVFCMIFVVLFVFVPEVLCAVHNGKRIALFDIQVVKDTWFIVVSFAVCGIVREIMQLTEGQYNRKVWITALVTNGISAALSIWWLTGFELINPVFLANMETLFAGEDRIVFLMFGHFDRFFLGVMLFALLLDTIDITVKTHRK